MEIASISIMLIVLAVWLKQLHFIYSQSSPFPHSPILLLSPLASGPQDTASLLLLSEATTTCSLQCVLPSHPQPKFTTELIFPSYPLFTASGDKYRSYSKGMQKNSLFFNLKLYWKNFIALQYRPF